jgi:HPr kinase/phosphorylase
VTITVPSDPVLVHATAIAIDRRAALLRGPSGAGKSDLALRLIDRGACLVADDQVELRRAGERVSVTAPAAIFGLIEIRGVGIVRLEAVAEATLALLVDLVPSAEIDRFPEIRCEDVLGLAVPCVALFPFEASAAAKLRFALGAFSANSVPAIMRR